MERRVFVRYIAAYFFIIIFLFLDLVIKGNLPVNNKIADSVVGSFPSFFSVLIPSIMLTTYKRLDVKDGFYASFLIFIGGCIYEFLQKYIPSKTEDYFDYLALTIGFLFFSLFNFLAPSSIITEKRSDS